MNLQRITYDVASSQKVFIVGSTTVGHMVVRYSFSLLRSIVHFGVLIMFSAQGLDAQAHMSAGFLSAPLTGTSIKRTPLSRTPFAATQAQALFEALPSVMRTITWRRFLDPCAIGNNVLALLRALPVIVPPMGHFIPFILPVRSFLSCVICEITLALKE